jgi:hypothetical protein
MQITAKLGHTSTSVSINQRMPVASLNLNAGRMTRFEKVNYDNLYVGAEVRDLTADPPIMGFIISIEEYGWSMHDDNAYSFSYFIHIINCDGKTIELDLEEIMIDSSLHLVIREDNDSDAT